MKASLFFGALLIGSMGSSTLKAQKPERVAASLPDIQRIYVDRLSGGTAAAAMRDILIASLNATGVFVLTDDASRADAVLRGAADDKVYIDSFDSDKTISGRSDGGAYSGSRNARNGSGAYGGFSGGDRESYKIRDRKHEAYAAVRLVNQAGDTIWSTTQESTGAKFRSASTDVGEKVARQLLADVSRSEKPPVSPVASRH